MEPIQDDIETVRETLEAGDAVQEWATPEALAALDRLVAERDRLIQALPDPDKLDLLADWFDQDDANKGKTSQPEVQADLRRWAKTARNALGGV